jgi:hypothetical protein
MAYFVYPLIGLLIVGVPVALLMRKMSGPDLGAPPRRDADAILPIGESEFTDRSAQEMAEAFLSALSVKERLALVRNPDEVLSWLSEAAEEVLAHPIVFRDLRAMGLASASGEARFHRFAVQMADGGMRMLCVVQTPRGPLVDYEAFARYGTARWGDLLEGAVGEEIRVMARTGTYYQYQFGDETEWAAFDLTSPDWPGSLTGYARRDSPSAGTLAAIVGKETKQRVTLKVRPEGESYLKRQVVIEKVIASGWVRTEGDLEARWLLQGRAESE